MDYGGQPITPYLKEFLNKQVQAQQKAAKAQEEKQKKIQEKQANRPPPIVDVLDRRQLSTKRREYLVRRYVHHTIYTSQHTTHDISHRIASHPQTIIPTHTLLDKDNNQYGRIQLLPPTTLWTEQR